MTAFQPQDADIKVIAKQSRSMALAMLAERYWQYLHARINRVLNNSALADDLTQETLIKAMRESRIFRPDFRIKAWLCRVSTNLTLNYLRDRKIHKDYLNRYNWSTQPPRRQEHQYFDKQQVSLLEIYLAELTPEHRTIIDLFYWKEFTYIEIAEMLDIPIGTVTSRIGRARRRLLAATRDDHELLMTSISMEQELSHITL